MGIITYLKYFNYKKWVSILTFYTLSFTILSVIFSFIYKSQIFTYYKISLAYITLDWNAFVVYGLIALKTSLPIIILVHLSFTTFEKAKHASDHNKTHKIAIKIINIVLLILVSVVIAIVAINLASLDYDIHIQLFKKDSIIILLFACVLILPIAFLPKIKYIPFSFVMFIIILYYILLSMVQ